MDWGGVHSGRVDWSGVGLGWGRVVTRDEARGAILTQERRNVHASNRTNRYSR